MSKHTIDLYTITHKVIIIKVEGRLSFDEALVGGCFPPRKQNLHRERTTRIQLQNVIYSCIDKSIFVNTSIYIYQQLIQYPTSHCPNTFQ